jgi:hypothetical protein
MMFRALAKRGKRPAALPIIGACRRYRKPGFPTKPLGHIWRPAKSQAVAASNDQPNVWQLQRVGIQKAGGVLIEHPGENESSTEFQNGGVESISKCGQKFGREQSRFYKEFNALSSGWGARIRTWEWRNQNPLPYHLATPQRAPDHTCASVPDQSPDDPGGQAIEGSPLAVVRRTRLIVLAAPGR